MTAKAILVGPIHARQFRIASQLMNNGTFISVAFRGWAATAGYDAEDSGQFKGNIAQFRQRLYPPQIQGAEEWIAGLPAGSGPVY